MDEKLDEKDLALIGELMKDSRLSEKGLARKTGIPMTTVHNRLGKLRGLGVIKGYTIHVDYARLGRPLLAFVLVKSAPGADREGLMARIAAFEGVCEAALVGGDYDIIVKARVPSLERLNSLVFDELRRLEAVADARMLIGFGSIENV